jgi:hypothetical protein
MQEEIEKDAKQPERLGIVGTLVLHSQFILIGILVIGAAVLTILH